MVGPSTMARIAAAASATRRLDGGNSETHEAIRLNGQRSFGGRADFTRFRTALLQDGQNIARPDILPPQERQRCPASARCLCSTESRSPLSRSTISALRPVDKPRVWQALRRAIALNELSSLAGGLTSLSSRLVRSRFEPALVKPRWANTSAISVDLNTSSSSYGLIYHSTLNGHQSVA